MVLYQRGQGLRGRQPTVRGSGLGHEVEARGWMTTSGDGHGFSLIFIVFH